MKRLFLVALQFLLVINAGNSFALDNGDAPVLAESEPLVPKIETIEQYAFLVVDLNNAGIKLEYGETVELVFTKNKHVKLYNLTGKDIQYFNNTKDKLVAFVTPEDLRYFQKETLKKVVFNREGKREVVRLEVPAGELARR